MLFSTHVPSRFLEVGVGRGDSLRIFLRSAASRGINDVEYYGFDTFDEGPPPDETAFLNARIESSTTSDRFWKMHNAGEEAVRAIASEFPGTRCLVKLFKGNSRNTLPQHAGDLPSMDLVFIDGGHSYQTVKSDWTNIRPLLRDGSIVVFDDFNCEVGVTQFVGELLSASEHHFSEVAFVPAVLSSWTGCAVIFTYSSEETSRPVQVCGGPGAAAAGS